MTQITISIPDEQTDRVVDALCARGGYSDSLGVTKKAFAKQFVINFVKGNVAEHEATQAALQAVETANEEVDLS